MRDDPHDPEQVQHIVDTALGFWKSKVLLTAIELGAFTRLGRRGLRLAALRDELGLHGRGCADFFDALVALGFLYREGHGEQAVYFNTRAGSALLDANSPDYMGGVLEMTNQRVYPFWSQLGEALKSGKPQNETKSTGQSWYEALYADPQRLAQFMAAMAGYQIANFRLLVDTFDFGRFSSFCDIGGASGALAIEVARRHPHIRCITYDLPAVEPIAVRRVADAGVGSRVQVQSGNFLTETLPEADVIAMGNILHNWSVATRQALIGKVFDALPGGGAFLAIEHLVDNDRRTHLAGMLMSLNMLVETADGSESTAAEFDAWCKEAGFARTEVLPISGGTHVGIAYKD